MQAPHQYSSPCNERQNEHDVILFAVSAVITKTIVVTASMILHPLTYWSMENMLHIPALLSVLATPSPCTSATERRG